MPIFSSTGGTMPSLSSTKAANRCTGSSSGLPCSEARSLARCTASCAFNVNLSQRIAMMTPVSSFWFPVSSGGETLPQQPARCRRYQQKKGETVTFAASRHHTAELRSRRRARRPSLHCCCWTAEGGRPWPVLALCGPASALGFQGLLAAHVDFDLLGLGFGFLRQGDLQHTLVVMGRYLIRIHRVRKREGASEAAILPLDATEVLFFLFLLELALAVHGERVVLDADINVLLVDARDFDLQCDVVLVFVDVHRRGKVGGDQGFLPALPGRVAEQPIHALL